MRELSVNEYDLLEFFGAEHVSREFGTEWFDSDSLYKFDAPDGLTVTCAVHPIHKDARITMSHHGKVYYDWQATALADIRFDRDEQCLLFISQTGDTLRLRLVPHIFVSHACKFRVE